jgi:hypothetical protein
LNSEEKRWNRHQKRVWSLDLLERSCLHFAHCYTCPRRCLNKREINLINHRWLIGSAGGVERGNFPSRSKSGVPKLSPRTCKLRPPADRRLTELTPPTVHFFRSSHTHPHPHPLHAADTRNGSAAQVRTFPRHPSTKGLPEPLERVHSSVPVPSLPAGV